MAELNTEARNPVKGAQTTLRIVEALKELDGGGVTEVSERLGLPKSSVHNYLSTLHQEEYVVKTGTEYHVGLRFLNVGALARQNRAIYEIAKPEVGQLADETGELVNLLVEEHGRGVYLHRDTGPNAVKVDSYTGHRVHLHNTALGKAVLAFTPEDYVEDVLAARGLPRTTPQTITDEERLFEELDRIRERRVAFDREERLAGLRCVAAPVTDDDDRAVGAISVSGPTRRMQGDRFESELPNLLLDSVNVIELNLTYS